MRVLRPRSSLASTFAFLLAAACAEGTAITDGAGGEGAGEPQGGEASEGGQGQGGGCNQAEVCNGADDDCDGDVDEGCDCDDGETQACYSGPAGTEGVGECAPGTQTCAGGAWGDCQAELLPGDELCDGLDNDCNDAVDDGFDVLMCGVGECAAMSAECFDGVPGTCVPGTPVAEICDGLDNNCDGTPDDGDPGAGLTCSTGLLGVCAAGTTACTGGAPACNQNVMSSAETCDGLDNDCNGDVDPGCCTNTAPLATASISPGGGTIAPYTAAAMNNGNPSCSNGWAWIENDGSPAGDYFQLTWASPVTIGSMTVDSVAAGGDGVCGVPSGRNILAATVQYWNGAGWVTAGSLFNQADYNFVFPSQITTTMLRLYDVTASPGNGNSLLFEWYVYASPTCVIPP
ncbi:MAG: hypothetical protein IPG04_08385 [Polyangiaceae bacterium]|jgi:hypothetical protein|nr:hypothetical protein [Polyangiaceae bacterium]